MKQLQFTDERLYVLGIGTGYMTDLKSGDFLYWSDKMQEANVSVSANDNELRAGLGNGPAIIVPTDPNITVTVTAAEYSEYVKAASVGAAIKQGAPVMVCHEVTAEGPNLAVDLSGGTPVRGIGMYKILCYVQEVGAPSLIYAGGTAYELDAATGTVDGFTAVSGTSYLVTYFVTQANATLTTVTSNIKGRVVRFVFSQPVYSNYDPAANSGDFWGWLHTVVPRLQLMPSGGGTNSSQTSFTETGFTGRAVAQDAAVITEECGECGFTGLPMMYRILQPCDTTKKIKGLIAVLGGIAVTSVGETSQLHPVVVVDDQLKRSIPPSDFSYISEDAAIASVGSQDGVIRGESEGKTRVAVFYQAYGKTFTDLINVTVLKATGAELNYNFNANTNSLLFSEEISGSILQYTFNAANETLTVE